MLVNGRVSCVNDVAFAIANDISGCNKMLEDMNPVVQVEDSSNRTFRTLLDARGAVDNAAPVSVMVYEASFGDAVCVAAVTFAAKGSDSEKNWAREAQRQHKQSKNKPTDTNSVARPTRVNVGTTGAAEKSTQTDHMPGGVKLSGESEATRSELLMEDVSDPIGTATTEFEEDAAAVQVGDSSKRTLRTDEFGSN